MGDYYTNTSTYLNSATYLNTDTYYYYPGLSEKIAANIGNLKNRIIERIQDDQNLLSYNIDTLYNIIYHIVGTADYDYLLDDTRTESIVSEIVNAILSGKDYITQDDLYTEIYNVVNSVVQTAINNINYYINSHTNVYDIIQKHDYYIFAADDILSDTLLNSTANSYAYGTYPNTGTNINTLPQNYLVIDEPDDTDLYKTTSNEAYRVPSNSRYIDILFNAIRRLQAEVTMLKNSFQYGIESETGTTTAMSNVINNYDDEIEPLWAVDESVLNPIVDDDLYIGIEEDNLSNLYIDSSEGGAITWENKHVNIEGKVNWTDFTKKLKTISETSNKIYLYLTVSSLDIDFIFNDLVTNGNLTINLSSIINTNLENTKYNVLLVVGKSIASDETSSYIYFSVSNYMTGNIMSQGYYKNGSLHQSPISYEAKYVLRQVIFNGSLSLYKFNLYYKNDEANTVNIVDEAPDDTKYKYKAAHITIRSVSGEEELEQIKNQVLKNELIYNEANNGLYIVNDNNEIKQISANSENNTTTGMTINELITLLEKNGIINISEDGGNDITLNNIADITFIHEPTGNKFNISVDADGELHSTALSDDDFASIIANNNISMDASTIKNIRGFIGNMGNKLHPNQTISVSEYASDLGLYSDRLKIGAIYAPHESLKTHACTHGYIELENTWYKDICLDGFYIHYCRQLPNTESAAIPYSTQIYSLPLKGYIKSGETYLIRCAQYANYNDPNVTISVDSYDIEWYAYNNDSNVNELLDTSIYSSSNNTYMITYGMEDIDISTQMIQYDTTKKYNLYHQNFVDAVSIAGVAKQYGAGTDMQKGTYTWFGTNDVTLQNYFFIPQQKSDGNYYDVIYKNVYELDPAKQAYQALYSKDSSRKRNDKDSDYQYLVIENDYIEFPKSSDKYNVSKFTPKASFEHKNVCTDKTSFNLEKPNMVTCSFGINIHTTRCFNWVSGGLFDEYVWVRQQDTDTWIRFESYHDSLTGLDENPGATAMSDSYPRVKHFGYVLNNTTGKYDCIEHSIYDRITGVFPGANIRYTSHKCILEITDAAPESLQTWEYVVGRSDKNGLPDPNHTSDIQTFTLYPNTYKPRIYQITDQQGFTWIEYQVWAAAANKLYETITYEASQENIIPILVNTGDMTQNGTRINEWLDYYNGGKVLFSKYEQMNTVGNNDLCNTDPEILGSGDDIGKSNGFYFHVFYCYEVDETILPVFNIDVNNISIDEQYGAGIRYIPSLYYFGDYNYAFVVINSELTEKTFGNWYNLTYNGQIINGYTGYTVKTSDAASTFISTLPHTNSSDTYTFTPVYNMVYAIFDKLSSKNIITICHEMPFTVITNSNLKPATVTKDRSLNGTSLVGSHLNIISNNDSQSPAGNYWFSRLLEHFGIKLCIGGHKHTYVCTKPVSELYTYVKNNEIKFSHIDGPMEMGPSLEGDTIGFTLYYNTTNNTLIYIQEQEGVHYQYYYDSNNNQISESVSDISTYTQINTTKFPIVEKSSDTQISTVGSDSNMLYIPCCYIPSSLASQNPVVYMMCQATGYKLKSNKELPSASQLFGYVIPKTSIDATTGADKPSGEQQYPMFVKIILDDVNYSIYLYRFMNILQNKKFTQLNYSDASEQISYQLLKHEQNGNNDIIFGNWVAESPDSSEQCLIQIQSDFVIMTTESNPEVMAILNDNGVFEGTEMYRSQATKITNDQLSYVFNGSEIKTFDEFKYFTGITELTDDMFGECYSLTSITIPASVTSIGDAIYSCPSLESITVDPNNTVYDSRNNCNAIIETENNTLIVGCQNTVIPDSVTSIGNGAFNECSSLASITIPDSVTSIGNSAFESCESLASITISDSVTSIGESAFNSCSLATIIIPDSVTSIGDSAFSYCSSLASITVDPNNTVYDSRDNCNAIIETETNTLIVGCKNTVIPDSVTSIGKSAFSGCSSLTSITIPDSVTSIGDWAFSSSGITSITISDSVTSIGGSTFNGCRSLTSINIPDSVTSIGINAFQSCTSLASVTIGNSVTSIGDYAFNGCSSLTSINIPDSVTSIGNYAFFVCSKLTSVTIGNSVTSIGNYAFDCCTSLTTITCNAMSAPSITTNTFNNISNNVTLHISEGATGYENWPGYDNRQIIS